MQEITAQVLKVEGKKSKNGQSTYYDVSLSDGNDWRTFDANLANTAAALQGQVVTAHGEIVQRGQYTNYDLQAIGPQGSLAALPVVAGTPVVVNGAVATPNIPMVSPPSQEETDKRISKFASVKTAFAFVGQLCEGAGPEAIEESAAKALVLAKELYAQVYGTSEAQVIPTTPAEVAAAVPGVQVGVEPAPEVPAQPAGVTW